MPLLPSKWLDLSTLFTDRLFSRVKIKTAEDLLTVSAREWRGEKKKKDFLFLSRALPSFLRSALTLACFSIFEKKKKTSSVYRLVLSDAAGMLRPLQETYN